MNLDAIQKAIRSYQQNLEKDDLDRLEFFQQIWESLDDTAAALELAHRDYTLPNSEIMQERYVANLPILPVAPVEIDTPSMIAALNQTTAAFVDSGNYPQDLLDELSGLNWADIIAQTELSDAGSEPAHWLEQVLAVLTNLPLSDQTVGLALVIASLSLRLFLETPARLVMDALEGGRDLPHSLLCPVCGSAPSLSRVGGHTSSQGKGRVLICSQCGADWEFERIRCARCGTREQSQLVYRHIDHDDAHRLGICKQCGGTIRTVFSEDADAPFSAEVEDVVMAKLDALSRDLTN